MILQKKIVLLIIFFCLALGLPVFSPAQKLPETLSEFIQNSKTVVTSHRAAPCPSVTESSLEALKKSHAEGLRMHEIDIRASADGALFIMHDFTLDRTTETSGQIDTFSAEQLRQIRLKNSEETIPGFVDMLAYARKHNLFLMLDLKRVNIRNVINEVIDHNMLSSVLLLTFSREAAIEVFEMDLPVLLSVLISDMDDLAWYKKNAPAPDLWLAYINQGAPVSLFHSVHDQQIRIVSDTMRNLDQLASEQGSHLYRDFIETRKIDVIVSDYPLDVRNALE